MPAATGTPSAAYVPSCFRHRHPPAACLPRPRHFATRLLPPACAETPACLAQPQIAPAAEPLRPAHRDSRSEEHTSELQSHVNLVCRLLLEKKKRKMIVEKY